MDIIIEKELNRVLTYLGSLNKNKFVQEKIGADMLSVFRSDILRYLLYLAGDEVTCGEADYINMVCGLDFSKERLSRLKREDSGNERKIPLMIHLMVQVDNFASPTGAQAKKFRGDRYLIYGSWGMIKLYSMLGNRFCAYEAGTEDSPEKIRKRKVFLTMLGKYAEDNLTCKKWYETEPYVPPVPDEPFLGDENLRFRLYTAYELDNPNMSPVGGISQNNDITPERAQEILKNAYIKVNGPRCNAADLNTITSMIRLGAKVDNAWSRQGSIARRAEHGVVEQNLICIPAVELSPVEEIWAEYDAENAANEEHPDGSTHIILEGPIRSPEEMGQLVTEVFNGLQGKTGKGKKASETDSKYEEMSLEELKKELEKLVGLKKVKEAVESAANMQRINKAREKKGLKANASTMHMVFTGNPGTGKTTVARLIAAIYKKMGILSKGQFVETDSEGLIAEYVGQTAVKTKEIVEKAMGGVLFIDEAYMLNGSGNKDFGDEAVAALIKLMEDKRDDLMVIFAGYTDLMEGFLNKNPGIRSRINKYINFEDYNGEELFEIFKLMCKESDYSPNEECLKLTREFFEKRSADKGKNYANGRDVRNYLEKAIARQADRLSMKKKLSEEMLRGLTAEDVTGIDLKEQDQKGKKHAIGFHTGH